MTGPRFLADEMLGKLARDLRALGYDAAYVRDVTDDEVLEQAVDEDRRLLTRDVHLAERAGERAVLLESRDPAEQVRRVVDVLDLEPAAERFLSRCLACNAELEATRAPDEVPEDVREAPHWRCPGCGNLYWRGSHADDMLDRLGDLLDGTPPMFDP